MVRGQVKWFDGSKGFGFIVNDDGGADILLHANVLRNFGRSSVAENTVVEVEVQETDRGMQATEIFSIELPIAANGSNGFSLADIELPDVGDAPLEPARVKWFDKVKGFGFVNIFGKSDDIFVHMEVLRICGLADLLPGEAICVRTADGPRGLMAAEVRVWDHANDGSQD